MKKARRMKKVNTRNLTPRLAWERYVDMSEKFFISNFFVENVREPKEMCRIYAYGLPDAFESDKLLFTQGQLETIQNLLTKYLEDFIKKNGGLDNIELYTIEELDAIFQKESDAIRSMLKGLQLGGKTQKTVYDLYYCDLNDEAQEELVEFAKHDYLNKYGDKEILKEVEKLKELGLDYDTLLTMKAMGHMHTFKYVFEM